ncbi:MAG TPA: PEGA domain-containing protein [Polyangiaceae bacterium]|jgi:hypothetical protein
MKKTRLASALLTTVLFSQAAWAEPTAADRATARTLAQEGQDALEAKKYSISVDRFSRAESLVHAPTLLLGLARAQLGLGNLVESQESYNRIIREGVSPNSPRSWSKALADASKEVQSLAPRIPWVTITVNGPTTPDVTVDANTVPAASLGVRRAVNPGEHSVKAMGEGYLPSTKTITLAEGQTLSVTLDLEKAPAPPPAPMVEATPPPVAPEPPKSTGSGRKTAAFLAYGVGAAGLITGGIAGALAIQKHSQLGKDGCTAGSCPFGATSPLNSYHSVALVSDIGFAVAGVGLVTGTILLLTAPRSSTSSQTGTNGSVSAYVGWGSAGVVGNF